MADWQICSNLQASVDRLAAKSVHVCGGLIVFGSIHTETVALLEGRLSTIESRTRST